MDGYPDPHTTLFMLGVALIVFALVLGAMFHFLGP